MSTTVPFVLVTAFSNYIFGGNPAAVVFLGDRELPTETLLKIAQNFNQPITSFLSSPSISDDGKAAKFGIRWFHPVKEVPICGHGSLAAAKAIFTSHELAPESVETIELQTPSNGVMTARREGSWLGMEWTPTFPEAVSAEEKTKIDGLLAKALGRDEIVTKFIGKGGKGYEHCVLIELDEEEDLGGLKVTIDELVSTHALFERLPFLILLWNVERFWLCGQHSDDRIEGTRASDLSFKDVRAWNSRRRFRVWECSLSFRSLLGTKTRACGTGNKGKAS